MGLCMMNERKGKKVLDSKFWFFDYRLKDGVGSKM